jgi:hypothetical protein
MKNLIKTAPRLVAIAALCALASACSQPVASTADGFPSYSAQAAVSAPSTYVAPSIMDY